MSHPHCMIDRWDGYQYECRWLVDCDSQPLSHLKTVCLSVCLSVCLVTIWHHPLSFLACPQTDEPTNVISVGQTDGQSLSVFMLTRGRTQEIGQTWEMNDMTWHTCATPNNMTYCSITRDIMRDIVHYIWQAQRLSNQHQYTPTHISSICHKLTIKLWCPILSKYNKYQFCWKKHFQNLPISISQTINMADRSSILARQAMNSTVSLTKVQKAKVIKLNIHFRWQNSPKLLLRTHLYCHNWRYPKFSFSTNSLFVHVYSLRKWRTVLAAQIG